MNKCISFKIQDPGCFCFHPLLKYQFKVLLFNCFFFCPDRGCLLQPLTLLWYLLFYHFFPNLSHTGFPKSYEEHRFLNLFPHSNLAYCGSWTFPPPLSSLSPDNIIVIKISSLPSQLGRNIYSPILFVAYLLVIESSFFLNNSLSPDVQPWPL